MIRIEVDTKDGNVTASLHHEVMDAQQAEDELEAAAFCVLSFMEEHSELSMREILMSWISDLDDNDGQMRFTIVKDEEAEEDGKD